jgi:hypothetical protein
VPALAGAVLVAAVAAVAAVTAVRATGEGDDAPRLPVLWLQTSGTPSSADLDAAVGRVTVVVLNAWEDDAAAELQRRDPDLVVLAYLCLSSTRSYEGAVVDGRDADVPAGVGYVQAQAHPEWFATDTVGRRVEWSTYRQHWQMAVWDPAYRDRWTRGAVERLAGSPFDGVLADNALSTLRYYTDVELAGGRDDADVRAGVRALVAQAGRALRAEGKLLVPNVSDGRLGDGWWEGLTRWGGGFEEQFVHFGEDPDDGYLTAEDDRGWQRQVDLLGGTALPLARTAAGPDEDRPFLFGLASFWLATGGQGAFAATGRDAYDGLDLRPEQTWHLGRPLGPAQAHGAARSRAFSRGLVAVNPSADRPAVVPLPEGLHDRSGPVRGPLELPPLTGAVLTRAPQADR